MANENPGGSLVVTASRSNGSAQLALAGRLNALALPAAWEKAVTLLRSDPPRRLTVDVSNLSYCDGAGLGLFAELRRIVSARGGEMTFTGGTLEQRRLLEMSLLKDPTAAQLNPVPRDGMVTKLGETTWGIIKDLGELVAFIGQLMATLVWALFHPKEIRFGETLRISQKVGADALPVVSLLGLLVGVILAFQTANPLERFGAQPLIPTIVSIAVVREMGPLITAIILSGRSGSAFAAEIGTMQITEELNALKTLGIEPVQFLVLPRVLAAMFMTPLLTVYNMLLSVFGGYIVMAGLGYSLNFYINSVTSAVHIGDFLGGIFKAFIFAMIVAGIGCLRGMQTKSGPGAVGDSTTRAVVAGIVLTIAADAVLGVLYYYMGI